MTKEQYRTALEALGLSRRQAARLLGVCERTSRAYANGAAIPPATATLLWVMMSMGISAEAVERIRGCFR